MRRSRSYTQQVHHHSATVNTTRTSKTFFFPAFCRLSLNDVEKPAKLTDLPSSSSSSISSSLDPSSPKISCIGQIKKRSSNATTNYHLTATRVSGKSATNLNYRKLRKLFSGKNLISPPIEISTISNQNRTCNVNATKPINSKKKQVISIEDPDVVRVEELDPPLPVVKFQPQDQQASVNLKKRRGIELKTLQIQPFQLPNVHSNISQLDRSIKLTDSQ